MESRQSESPTAESLLRHIQFRPWGHRLLTSSAEFWFLSARILVFTMAIAEAIAWGYLGYLFGDGSTRWVGAVFAGGIIFVVVWMIDVSLITMDRAAREHTAALSGRASAEDLSPAGPKKALFRDLFTFGTRIALLIGSLTITAPYLAQVVFHKDIERFIDKEATSALDATRKQITDRFDTEIAAKDRNIDEKRTVLEHEVAGKGLSGRYGRGPAAEAVARDVRALENERDTLLRTKEATLSAYDKLALDWRSNREALQAGYNVEMPQASILQNSKALSELRKLPENRATELAIRAFLAFIFTGLLLLKLFEPGSVRLYLSDALQQEYDSYLAGTFDAMLPPTERSTVKGFKISPQRFYSFLVRVGIRARRLAEENDDVVLRAVAANKTLRDLAQVEEQVERELEQLQKDHLTANDLLEQRSRALSTWQAAIGVVEGDIRHFQESLDVSERTMAEPESDIEDEQGHFEHRRNRIETESKLKRELASANLAMSKLRARGECQQSAKRAEERFNSIDAHLHHKQDELDSIKENIRAVRQQIANDQARVILDRSA